MAGRGPAPKDPEKRARRNADVPMTEIPRDARPARPPALPRTYVLRSDEADRCLSYLPETRRWYRTLATSPQATQFLATDWERIRLFLAPLVDRYLRTFDHRLLAEIRLQESSLGVTALDRLRLRWRISEGAKGEEPAVLGRSRRRPDPRRLAVVT
jgi:hypothetical protein